MESANVAKGSVFVLVINSDIEVIAERHKNGVLAYCYLLPNSNCSTLLVLYLGCFFDHVNLSIDIFSFFCDNLVQLG
jgi:hypothetical protein